MDLLFGAHVDPLGGFVQQQDLAAGHQPFRQYDLLLITTAQISNDLILAWCLHIELADVFFDSTLLGRKIEKRPKSLVVCQRGQGHVVTDRQGHGQTRAQPVLCQEPDAMLCCLTRRLDLDRLPRNVDLAALESVDTEYGPGQLGAARSHQSEEGQDFALVGREIDVMQNSFTIQLLNPQ